MKSEHLVGTSIPRFTFDTPTTPGNDFYKLCEGEHPLVMIFLPAFDQLLSCLRMATYIVARMRVNEHILDNPMYDPMFSVEEVNRLAAAGMPFRDAYKKVGLEIEAGEFVANKNIHHTHEGSVGNLCNDKIQALMEQTIAEFSFDKVRNAEKKLLDI